MASVALAAASCAQILGLEDPAGRLDDGSGGSSATAAQGNPAGTGTGSPDAASTGTSAVSSASSGDATTASSAVTGGGGGGGGGVTVLASSVRIDALGAGPDDSASLLVKNVQGVSVDICGGSLASQFLGAVRVDGDACTLVREVEVAGANAEAVQGTDVEMRGDWVGIAGIGNPVATVAIDETPLSLISGNGSGFSALWRAGGGEERILAVDPMRAVTSRILLDATMGGTFVFDAFGFEVTTPPGCGNPVKGMVPAVWGASIDVLGSTCALENAAGLGILLDATAATSQWALRSFEDECHLDNLTDASTRPLLACATTETMFGNLFADDAGSEDDVFAAIKPLCLGRLGIVRAGEASPAWCDIDVESTAAYPFRFAEPYLWFVRQNEVGAQILRVDVEVSTEDATDPICEGCEIVGALVSEGRLYVAGTAGVDDIEVFGETVPAGRSFWAWKSVDDL